MAFPARRRGDYLPTTPTATNSPGQESGAPRPMSERQFQAIKKRVQSGVIYVSDQRELVIECERLRNIVEPRGGA